MRFLGGLIAGFLSAILLGEFLSRISPPADLEPFLGENSSLAGVYRPDPELGVDYRSVADFRAENNGRLRQLGRPSLPRRTWLWFGNSFVQAPAMLGDTSQADRRDIRMFFLRKNVDLPLRVAQLKLLLDSEKNVERVIFVILPVDLIPIGRQPLSTIRVNRRGAITYEWRRSGSPLDRLISRSRLALLAWVRSGQHAGDPSFRKEQVSERLATSLKNDLGTLLHAAGDTCRRYNVHLTVVLLPNREQVLGQAHHALQDFVNEYCASERLDCFDARDIFAGVNDKTFLFIPDGHFNDRGNRLVLDALYAHCGEVATSTVRP